MGRSRKKKPIVRPTLCEGRDKLAENKDRKEKKGDFDKVEISFPLLFVSMKNVACCFFGL